MDNFTCLFRNDNDDGVKYEIENLEWTLSVISMTVKSTLVEYLEKKWQVHMVVLMKRKNLVFNCGTCDRVLCTKYTRLF